MNERERDQNRVEWNKKEKLRTKLFTLYRLDSDVYVCLLLFDDDVVIKTAQLVLILFDFISLSLQKLVLQESSIAVLYLSPSIIRSLKVETGESDDVSVGVSCKRRWRGY